MGEYALRSDLGALASKMLYFIVLKTKSASEKMAVAKGFRWGIDKMHMREQIEIEAYIHWWKILRSSPFTAVLPLVGSRERYFLCGRKAHSVMGA